jgi:hypothetical protein
VKDKIVHPHILDFYVTGSRPYGNLNDHTIHDMGLIFYLTEILNKC